MTFFQKLSFSVLAEIFRNFPQIFCAAILDPLDLKNLIKSILRFIAFDLIFHLPYFLKCFENIKLCKNLRWKFFWDNYCNTRKLKIWTGSYFWDFKVQKWGQSGYRIYLTLILFILSDKIYLWKVLFMIFLTYSKSF